VKRSVGLSNGAQYVSIMNLSEPPTDLPVPEDTGAGDHLAGLRLSDVTLTAIHGRPVTLVIIKFFYLVFPPDRNTVDATAWLQTHV
jgi:hypothetical protein